MCNTSNALCALVLSKQTSLSENCLKLFAVNNGSRSSSLRQFQAAGTATEKARRPYVERLCRGTSSWRRLAEHRWRRDATSEIGVQQCGVWTAWPTTILDSEYAECFVTSYMIWYIICHELYGHCLPWLYNTYFTLAWLIRHLKHANIGYVMRCREGCILWQQRAFLFDLVYPAVVDVQAGKS